MITAPRTPVAHKAVTDEGRMPDPTRSQHWRSFRVLPENRSAVRAAKRVAFALLAGRKPPFSPLVLHGLPGTGKTHLLAALCGHLSEGPRVVTIRPVSAG